MHSLDIAEPDAASASKADALASASALTRSPLLVPWTDPESGITSFVLSRRVAPFQQSFYYVNPSFSGDGRYFWFYSAFPPGGSANQGRTLGVVDFLRNSVRHFPETAFTDASPMVDPRSGEAYWCAGLEVWKRGAAPEAKPVLVNRFPAALARNRRPWRLATHLSLSADRLALGIDAEIGNEWFVGHLPLDGGDFVLWDKFDRCYNHGQFSPTDPDAQLIAQDYSVPPLAGGAIPYENRLWIARRGSPAFPLLPHPIPAVARARGANPHYASDASRRVTDERAMCGHEWWGADGRHVWYIHYDRGMARVAVDGTSPGRPELVWPHETITHGHADASGTLLVCDSLPPHAPDDRRVTFRNRTTGREVDIVSRMPDVPGDLTRYHVHPHPQFCLDDSVICYTTLVLGQVDVAFCPVEALVARTA